MDGWKTHLVAVMVALVAIMEGPLGIDIPGAEMQADWLEFVMSAFGLSAVRDALRKLNI